MLTPLLLSLITALLITTANSFPHPISAKRPPGTPDPIPTITKPATSPRTGSIDVWAQTTTLYEQVDIVTATGSLEPGKRDVKDEIESNITVLNE
jgi:hypothetical protein